MKSEALTTDQFTATQLGEKACEAYEQKRTKECIELSRALLLADPDNDIAQKLLTAVHADMQRDIDDARALITEAKSSPEDGQKYRKAAEIILRKILHLDPTNEEALSLMSVKPAAPQPNGAYTAYNVVQPARTETNSFSANAPVIGENARGELSRSEEVPFTATATPTSPPQTFEIPKETNRGASLPIFVAVAVLVVIGALIAWQSGKRPGAADRAEASAPAPRPSSTPAQLRERIPPPAPSPVQEPAAPAAPLPLPATPAATQPALAPARGSTPPPPALDPVGTLAVSSPVPADIYFKDRYLGSTPTSLVLPAGRQTLEYRYGDLTTTATHNIRASETITAAVTFQVTVQINARPWAQVFLEGGTRRALGQTPLSSVRVPIGSVLTFENPNYSTKTHKIAGNDSAIFVDFQ